MHVCVHTLCCDWVRACLISTLFGSVFVLLGSRGLLICPLWPHLAAVVQYGVPSLIINPRCLSHDFKGDYMAREHSARGVMDPNKGGLFFFFSLL